MEASAATDRAIAWVCPECGHGSPEPRDQAAHLDAHGQLEQFFRAWDDAVASGARADAADARRRRRRLWAVVAVAVLCVAAVALAGLAGGGGEPARRSAPGVPVPGVDLPRSTAPSVAVDPPPPLTIPAAVQGPADAPTRPPPSAAARGNVPVSRAEAAPAEAAGAVTAAQPATAAPPAGARRLRACLLGICITVH